MIRVLLVAALVVSSGRAFAAGPPSYTSVAKPLFASYCTRCHNEKKPEGGVDLASFADEAAAIGKRKLWKRALARIAAAEMPPEGAKPLTPADREKLTAWLTAAGEHLDCDLARRDPGPSLLRRLTRTEYQNTIRDLLGLHIDARRDLGLPDEDPGEGHFDNLAAGLRISPPLMDKYFTAADQLVRALGPADGSGRWFRTRIGFLQPPAAEVPPRDAARQVLATLARRAYRHEPAPNDVERLLGFYDRSRSKGASFDDGIFAALKPVLVSPQFLYRFEQDRPSAGNSPGVPVDDYELASRLSYFLWSTMPDDELFTLAEQKKLSEPATLEKQIARMIQGPKAQALTGALTQHWLRLKNFTRARPTVEFFPEFGYGMKQSMSDEVRLFVDHLRSADRPILDLLDADYTFANEELAKHYGIPGVSGNQLRKVALKPENHRGGLLGMGAVLAMTSHTFRTSPTQRGKYVLDVLLGTPPPPPPPDAGQLKEDDPKDKKKAVATFREKLAQHATQASCAGCHRKIDPLGFAMDNFNAVGAWRESTKDVPLDVGGVLPSGEKVDGMPGLKRALLARKDQFALNLISQTLEYALGRELDGQDECTVREVHSAMQKNGYKFSTMIVEIVKSVPFRQRASRER